MPVQAATPRPAPHHWSNTWGQTMFVEKARAEESATAAVASAETAATLHDLATPCLLLDADRMERNIDRLRARLSSFGVTLRPHLKTSKSVDIARRVMLSPAGPATVSTLREAAQFAAAGVDDILYAVGIAPAKLPQVLALRTAGIDVTMVLDSVEQAHVVAQASRKAGTRIPALIEIDCDGHRAGVLPTDRRRLVDIGRALEASGELRGVMTHAGASYGSVGPGLASLCRGRAAQRRRRRRDPARGGASVRGGQRRLHADGAQCNGLLRRDRSPCGRVRVLRSRDGRHRRLPGRRHRGLGARDGDRTPARQRLGPGRRRVDGDCRRIEAPPGRRSIKATGWCATSLVFRMPT